MRRPSMFIVLAGALMTTAVAQDTGQPTGRETHAELVQRALAPGDGGDAWRARLDASMHLHRDRSEVSRATVDVLAQRDAFPEGPIAWGSRLHVALQMAETWRLEKAKYHLLENLACTIDPETLPRMAFGEPTVESMYPAARALTKIPVRPREIMEWTPKKDVPIAAYILCERLGKDEALAMLEHLSRTRPHALPHAAHAAEILRSVEQPVALLPRILRKR